MKFYKYNKPFFNDKITAVYNINAFNYLYFVQFIKNGKICNSKNSARIYTDGYKYFYFYDKCYGFNFTKSSWRKFVKSLKLQVFL